MNQWPRNAMSLYVAVAVHAVLFFLLGWAPPSQDSAGEASGISLRGSVTPLVESLVSAVPDRLLAPAETVAQSERQLSEAPPQVEPAQDLEVALRDESMSVAREMSVGVADETEVSERAEAEYPPAPAPVVTASSASDRTAETVAGAEGGGGIDEYFARLRAHLARHRRPMPIQWQGAETLIGFDLQADGWVKQLRVVESSGIEEMDAAAFTLLDRSLPLPRPPKEVLGPLLVPIGAGNIP